MNASSVHDRADARAHVGDRTGTSRRQEPTESADSEVLRTPPAGLIPAVPRPATTCRHTCAAQESAIQGRFHGLVEDTEHAIGIKASIYHIRVGMRPFNQRPAPDHSLDVDAGRGQSGAQLFKRCRRASTVDTSFAATQSIRQVLACHGPLLFFAFVQRTNMLVLPETIRASAMLGVRLHDSVASDDRKGIGRTKTPAYYD
jgi:hypothetical protein